ncbi:MAG: hypothetical protein RR280_10245 [Bacteroidaceae bacterium]
MNFEPLYIIRWGTFQGEMGLYRKSLLVEKKPLRFGEKSTDADFKMKKEALSGS